MCTSHCIMMTSHLHGHMGLGRDLPRGRRLSKSPYRGLRCVRNSWGEMLPAMLANLQHSVHVIMRVFLPRKSNF